MQVIQSDEFPSEALYKRLKFLEEATGAQLSTQSKGTLGHSLVRGVLSGDSAVLYFRTLGEDILGELVVPHLLEQEPSEGLMKVLGLLLQYTDAFNYTILSYLVK